jgi:hypothetical protein
MSRRRRLAQARPAPCPERQPLGEDRATLHHPPPVALFRMAQACPCTARGDRCIRIGDLLRYPSAGDVVILAAAGVLRGVQAPEPAF